MTAPFLCLFLMVICIPVSSAGEPEQPFHVDLNNPAALEEAARVLGEEIKLAARPHTYLVVDLVANAIIMKARGVELQRLPLSKWSAESREAMAATYRLMARPAVVRRKIDPSAPEQEPISLADMPTHYHLDFTPPFILEVVPPVEHAPLRWALVQARGWARSLRAWMDSLFSRRPSSPQPRLILTLPEDGAQSLAWSLVDGMPLVIRRPDR